jgi:protein-S-isoprenylcysteine O-methyltransferase Ste14
MRFRFSSLWLTIRSILWAGLFPGLIAGYIPWRYFGVARVQLNLRNSFHFVAVLVIAIGAALLAVCIWEFAHSGRGTLAPVDPPKQLVVRGLYRYVRNPMYLSVTLILLGQLMLTRSSALLAYLAFLFAAVNLFVIGYEEPTLRRQFGESYEQYTQAVNRWIPTFRSHRQHP